MHTRPHTRTCPHMHCLTYLAFFSPSSCLMMSSLSIYVHSTSFHDMSIFISCFLLGKSTGLSLPTFPLLPKRQGSWGESLCPESHERKNVNFVHHPGAPFPSSGVLGIFNFCASLSVLTYKTGSVVLSHDHHED